MPRPGFFKELQRHHVFRVAAAYAVVGWLVIQVVAILFPVLDLPAWLEKIIVVLVLAGFPVALVVAWAFQTPRDELHASQGIRHRSLRIGFALGVAGVLVALVAGGIWWWLVPESRSRAASNAIATKVAPASTQSDSATAVPGSPDSIAVLPLGVLGDDSGDSYLGEGISEEILNALSRVPGLEVIGRTSSFRFTGNTPDARVIGRELGVHNLLSGVVQRAGVAGVPAVRHYPLPAFAGGAGRAGHPPPARTGAAVRVQAGGRAVMAIWRGLEQRPSVQRALRGNKEWGCD